MPLLGRVDVTSHTLDSFQKHLRSEYRKYIKTPNIIVSLTPRPIYIVEKDTAGNVLKIKEAHSVTEAKALVGSQNITIKHGDIIEIPAKQPIYIVQHNLAKNTWDVKTAYTIEEAKALAGKDYKGEIKYGDTVTIKVGKDPDWFEDNWYKIITATGVITGIVMSLGR
jgi:protein involved in polysaccharide export with SLBB domain